MKNTEIEHKFLLHDTSYRQMATRISTIRQGYLSTDPDRTIRIRLKDDKAFITIKSRPNAQTLARFEWEREIDPNDAQEMLKMCPPYIIEKERYIVQWKDIIIEIDEFHGVNEGLCIAEIELDDINQTLPELPGFIGQEVSHDSRYSNSYLALLPYTMW